MGPSEIHKVRHFSLHYQRTEHEHELQNITRITGVAFAAFLAACAETQSQTGKARANILTGDHLSSSSGPAEQPGCQPVNVRNIQGTVQLASRQDGDQAQSRSAPNWPVTSRACVVKNDILIHDPLHGLRCAAAARVCARCTPAWRCLRGFGRPWHGTAAMSPQPPTTTDWSRHDNG
jgi:hypothetical protein